MTIFTQVMPRTSAIWFFMYCVLESSTELPAMSWVVPYTSPSRLSVISPSTVPAAMGASSVSSSRSL